MHTSAHILVIMG